MKKIEFDNIIKNKEELLHQLESLKEEAIYMLRNPFHDEVFQKDLHALRIVISIIESMDLKVHEFHIIEKPINENTIKHALLPTRKGDK